MSPGRKVMENWERERIQLYWLTRNWERGRRGSKERESHLNHEELGSHDSQERFEVVRNVEHLK